MAGRRRAQPKTYASAMKEFEAFKQRVKDVTWEYDGGCYRGKADFLAQLDLSDPPGDYLITVTATYRVTSQQIEDSIAMSDDQSLEDEIGYLRDEMESQLDCVTRVDGYDGIQATEIEVKVAKDES